MKLLFQYYSGGGGAVENLKALLITISRANPTYEIFIICNDTSALNELGTRSNISIITPRFFVHKELVRLWLGFFGLKRYVKKIKPDILWSLNFGSYRKVNVPNVLSVHNAHFVYPKNVRTMHQSGRVYFFVMRYFFRKSFEAADRIITQTNLMKEYLLESDTSKQVSVISKAIETDKDMSFTGLPKNVVDRLSELHGMKKLLYIASNYSHKNHEVVIKAMNLLSETAYKASLLLSISEPDFLKICNEIDINGEKLLKSSTVVCLGWVEKEWLRSLYSSVDACVMPSKLECLSSAYIEAMAWEKPQIVSDLPFAKETCGNAAIYVEPDDFYGWSENIKELLASNELQYELVRLGQIKLKSFPKDWENASYTYSNLFSKMVGI